MEKTKNLAGTWLIGPRSTCKVVLPLSPISGPETAFEKIEPTLPTNEDFRPTVAFNSTSLRGKVIGLV